MKTRSAIQTLAKTGKNLSEIILVCCIVGFCGCVVGSVSLALGAETFKLGGVAIADKVCSGADKLSVGAFSLRWAGRHDDRAVPLLPLRC